MTNWIAHESDNGQEKALFCFPHAGGTAAYFAKWGNVITNMAIMPVQFPMREKRIRDKMPDTIQKLAQNFIDENIDLFREREFSFLGHCSGSIVAYEATKYLEQRYDISPASLFVSSCYAPEDYKAPNLSTLSNEELLEVIKDSGFVTPELIENPLMFEYFAPIAKTDFSLQEHYVSNGQEKVNASIIAMYGVEDASLPNKEFINNWENYVERNFSIEKFQGSHFYLEENLEEVAGMLNRYF